MGGTTTLHNAFIGGTWSSGYPIVASVDLYSGTLSASAVYPGTAIITYTLGCGGCSVTTEVTVYPIPQPILGGDSLCVGRTLTLTSLTTGGTWSSSVISVGSIDPVTGVLTGIAAGTSIITYTSVHGCITSSVVTVNPTPTPII
jgi:uncharacterized protein YjdB